MQNGMMKWLSKLLRFKDNQKGNNIIMKLVSSERIKNYIQTQINPYGKPFKGTAYEFGIKLLDYLNNKDADYDVEKVVEQLKNEKEFWSDTNAYNKEIGEQKARSYEHAIEIVQSNGCVKTTLKKDSNGWIPCSERLPETLESEAKAYLTINKEGEMAVSYYHHSWSNGYESVFDVIAWQPLPEPYEEETEDE